MLLRVKIYMQFCKVSNDSHSLAFTYGYFFSAPALKKSHVVQSDDETEEVRPISTFFFQFPIQFQCNSIAARAATTSKAALSMRDYHHLKTLNLKRLPFYSRRKPRMLMHFSIYQRRLVESHREHVFFASTFGIYQYWPFITYCSRAKGSMQTIVAESTTLHCHIEAIHLVSEL